MQVLVALDKTIETYTFPDDSDVYFKTAAAGFIQISPRGAGKLHWFNPDYVIAILPGGPVGDE
jgi:hypothetical protein